MQDLKIYHMQHHYKDGGLIRFGVSNKLWDYVFQTTFVEDVKKKK